METLRDQRLIPLAEPDRFVRARGRVARAIGMCPGPGQLAPIHNEVRLTDGTPLEPALQDFAYPRRVARLRGEAGAGRVRRHAVVRHRPPGMILGRWLREPDIPRVPRQLAALERPDYAYLKKVFQHTRALLAVRPTQTERRFPELLTDAELVAFYEAVWQARNPQHMVLVKLLLFTGLRNVELAHVRPQDVDLDHCQDTGKDSGQKLMDVSYRSAAGPCNLPRVAAMIRARSTHSHSTDIMDTGVFTKPLAPSLV
jgi:hypothetical protein